MEVLSIEEIKSQYPNQWVLLTLENEVIQSRPQKGIVLLYGTDYLELCYKASEIAKNMITTTLFTGETSKKRKWLKFIHLEEKPKMI
jgi:hypothetical protein